MSFFRLKKGVNLESFLANGDFGRLSITFANRLDQDQDQHTIGPDLDPNCRHSDSVPERIF